MEITIEKAGGLTGRTEKIGPVDTAGLSQDNARQIRDIVGEMNFFALPTTIAKAGGADVIEYQTTITDGGRSYTVYSNDLTDPTYQKQLGQLINALEVSGAQFVAVEPPSIVPHFVVGASRYDLTGDGVTLAYFPFASLNKGEPVLKYSDAHRSLDFYDKDVRTVDVADLGGPCVSVTLDDGGAPWRSTTATMLVPAVVFHGGDTAWSFPVQTVMITRSPDTSRQGTSYKMINLVGQASDHI
jgi:hypothetical protein